VAVLTAGNLEDLPVSDVEQAMRNMGAFGWPISA
jgi:hypothetical protein